MEKPSELAASQQEAGARRWVEPVTAMVMAFATLCTAWCSYESAAWTRRANRLMNEFNALERRAGLLSVQGLQTATIHSGIFMQWLTAREAGKQELADFYMKRFPPDMRKAFDAWVEQKPLESPNADPHPFVPHLYQMQGSAEASEASAKAARNLQEARVAGEVSGEYLASTVLFAVVLFFASASGKFVQARVRSTAFAFAMALFIFALVRTVLLPG